MLSVETREPPVTDHEPQCDGCGERPEVHGSSWCAQCHEEIPERAKRRICILRNALIDISTTFHGNPKGYMAAANRAVEIADKALDEFPQRR